MRVVTNKELAKEPNGSLVICLEDADSKNEIDFYRDRLPTIFVGQYNDEQDRENGYWNGMTYLYPFLGDEHNCVTFQDDEVNSGKDVVKISQDDIMFCVDDSYVDYSKDTLFAVYSEDEKKSFVKELIGYLGYTAEDIANILNENDT